MDRLDLRTVDDKITGGLDVNDEVITFDLANGTDLFASLLEEHVVADIHFVVMSHDASPPRRV
jgi:hypothetical protein